MAIIPITLPPGFFKNGTPYSAKGRWADGNLVRWKEGALRAIGGWQRRKTSSGLDIAALYADPTTEAARNIMPWRSNIGNSYILIGTNKKLKVLDAAGLVTDVTPAGFVAGTKDETANTGYGGSFFGAGNYGTSRASLAPDAAPVFTWSLDTWGEDALASERGAGSQLYEWTIGDPVFTVIPNAPTGFNGFVVTDHRFVMTFGSTSDPRLVQWSDREDNNDWTPAATNQAGSFRLEGKGRLLSGWNILGQVLILSETDAFVARYINPPYVYGFNRVGVDCGPLCAGAVVIGNNIAAWLGKEGFFVFDGRVNNLHCDILDFLLSDKSNSADSKITTMHVPEHNEFWWLYQSENATEVDSYIAFNYELNIWYNGVIDRTVGTFVSGFNVQLMVSDDGIIYDHDLDGVAPVGATPYAVTGPLELGLGEVQMMVQRIYPDVNTLGDVTVTLLGRDMPTEDDLTYGPYTLANPTMVRARGREIRMKVEQSASGWKVGNAMRFEVVGGGAR